jgi:hypothetical protein
MRRPADPSALRRRATARCLAARAAHKKAERRLKAAQEAADATLTALNDAIVECQRLGAPTRKEAQRP